jgi:predicted transposase/invertase (TIGR01784 family)
VSGGDYGNLCQTIFIGLLDFSLFKEDGWYWDFVLTNAKSGKVLTDDLLLIFVEMRKLAKILAGLRQEARSGKLDSGELTTRLALWGGYVTSEGVDIVSELITQDEVFAEVLKVEKDYWGDSRNRFIQMMEEKRERDAVTDLAFARREGKAEGKAGIALNLLAMGIDIHTVSRATGLSIGEIGRLQAKTP